MMLRNLILSSLLFLGAGCVFRWVPGLPMKGPYPQHATPVATNTAAPLLRPAPAPQLATVTLAWSPPGDVWDVAGYDLYQGPVSRVYTNMLDVGNATNCLVKGLIPGGLYYFTVAAYDRSGLESHFSNEVPYLVPKPGPKPPPKSTPAPIP